MRRPLTMPADTGTQPAWRIQGHEPALLEQGAREIEQHFVPAHVVRRVAAWDHDADRWPGAVRLEIRFNLKAVAGGVNILAVPRIFTPAPFSSSR